MQAIINGEMYEVEPAVKVIIDKLMIENAELKKENARLEEGYQKSIGVIAATDWECQKCPVELRERELEVWQGYGTTITAPKGTFDKIFNDEEGEE